MRKKAVCLLLALVAYWTLLSHVPLAYADEVDGYTYTVDNDHATITRFDRGTATDITIPDTLGGVPVTTIGEIAFYITDLVNVVFPNGLTSIGDNAFGYNFLTSVHIPNSVTSIGARAFQHNKLTSLVIPDSVTSMGQEAFKDNLLTSVDLPDHLTAISDFAFRGNQLASVVIPDSVQSIGGYSFRYNNLSSVTLLGNSTVISDNAFNNNQAVPANLKIFGYAGSAAQAFAARKGFTFVDGSSLFVAMHKAKQLAKDHLPGTAIGQVPTNIYDDLTQALDDAKLFVHAITYATGSSDLQNAAADLNAAIAAFEGAIVQAGDAAALESLLIEANRALTDHPEGTGAGETSGAARTMLLAAIGAAQAVADDSANQTQRQLDAAADALSNALAQFNASWIEVTLMAPTDDLYGKSRILHFTLNYGYDVTVTGMPRIPLTIGTGSVTEVVYASYTGARGVPLTELSFAYEVPEGLADEDGIAVAPQLDLPAGASIARAGGGAAALAYPQPDTRGLRIVSIPPTVTLGAVPNGGSSADVTVTATVRGMAAGNMLTKLAWKSGSRVIADFAGGSGADILAAKQFSVNANGNYTVYAKDAAGNETVKAIAITSIEATSPGSGPVGNDPEIRELLPVQAAGTVVEIQELLPVQAAGTVVEIQDLLPVQAETIPEIQEPVLLTLQPLELATYVPRCA